MDVIPVIDVRHGVAVAAARGARDRYPPLATPLAEGCDPAAVARGLGAFFPFARLYIADLDGIEGREADPSLPGRVAAAMPGAEVWLDAGRRPGDLIGDLLTAPPGAIPVIGSESLRGAPDMEALRALPGNAYVLSLDFKAAGFAGPPELLTASERWPDRVIVMTLARVGSGEGPDLERLGEVVARAGRRAVYAAGGVRNIEDIAAVARTGAAGVLIASALHAGTITAGDLEKIAGR